MNMNVSIIERDVEGQLVTSSVDSHRAHCIEQSTHLEDAAVFTHGSIRRPTTPVRSGDALTTAPWRRRQRGMVRGMVRDMMRGMVGDIVPEMSAERGNVTC